MAGLIRLPSEDSRDNYLRGFWQWVEMLSHGDYAGAVDALLWASTRWTADGLKNAVTTFFGGDEAWSVVIPNDRLIDMINENAKYAPGWLMAQIPLTTAPEEPKNDQIPLMGLAASFFLRELDGSYVLELEIFHA